MSDFSPLRFARDFEQFRAGLNTETDPVDGLALMLDFWKNHSDSLPHQSNWTYLAEFIGELTGRCTKDNLENLSFDELKSIHALLKTLSERNNDNIKDVFGTVRREYSRKLLYVGDYETALKILGDDTAIDSADRDLIKGLNEFDTLYHIYSLHKDIESPVKSELLNILTEWEGYRESLYQDQALCLFVEKDSRGIAARGRMKFLSARVELFRKSAPIDEVTFDNQIKTPDDPFIGVAYDALESVRGIFKRSDFRHKAVRRYHAHFNIAGRNHQFTGDSIGLAAALLTYTQLMKPEIVRHERFLSSDVAFTGSIDKEGHILPVNGETIAFKVERAFFSPVKYLVVPEGNLATAQSALEKMTVRYPNRRLLMVGAAHLSDLLENRNIIRSEKVCIGQLTARRVVKYSRMTKLQVPLLMCLLYVLICLIYPKAWIWFDWNIDHIKVIGNRFLSINSDNHFLWASCEFPMALQDSKYNDSVKNQMLYFIEDFDSDGKKELFFAPHSLDLPAEIIFFDHDGKIVWRKNPYVITTYPGDISYPGITENAFYIAPELMPYEDNNNEKYIICCSFASAPGRAQVILLDLKGNCVSGPYINPGALGFLRGFRIDRDADGNEEILCYGLNNRFPGPFIAILEPKEITGIAPPYDDEYFMLSGMPSGNQDYYVVFPKSPLSVGSGIYSSIYAINVNSEKSSFQITTAEGVNIILDGERKSDLYELPHLYYVMDSNYIPIKLFPEDSAPRQINDLLIKLGRQPIGDFERLLDSLKSEIVVYHKDSIIHHLSAGIDFYHK